MKSRVERFAALTLLNLALGWMAACSSPTQPSNTTMPDLRIAGKHEPDGDRADKPADGHRDNDRWDSTQRCSHRWRSGRTPTTEALFCRHRRRSRQLGW